MPLLPWQRYVLDDALTRRGDEWARRSIGVLVARQNGKSHLMRMRLLAGMFLWGERWIAIANNRGLAFDQWKEAVELIERTDWLMREVKDISRTNGKEGIFLKNGGRWIIAAATKGGTRGLTGNLWIDEGREITEEAAKAAQPVTRAVKPKAQTWVTSNAGDAYSVYLNKLRTKALESSLPTLGWYEYSADPKFMFDQMNPEGWVQANPSLGHLIDEDTIALAAETSTPEEFATETLCLWVNAVESPWVSGSWEKCTEPELALDSSKPVFLSVDLSPSRQRADLVASQMTENGKVGVWLLSSWESAQVVDTRQIADDIYSWCKRLKVRTVVFDQYSAQEVVSRLSMRGVPTQALPTSKFAEACDHMLNAMNSGRIRHTGDAVLSGHIYACARKPLSDGGWRVIRRGSQGHISAACAAIMAAHLASAPVQNPVIVTA